MGAAAWRGAVSASWLTGPRSSWLIQRKRRWANSSRSPRATGSIGPAARRVPPSPATCSTHERLPFDPTPCSSLGRRAESDHHPIPLCVRAAVCGHSRADFAEGRVRRVRSPNPECAALRSVRWRGAPSGGPRTDPCPGAAGRARAGPEPRAGAAAQERRAPPRPPSSSPGAAEMRRERGPAEARWAGRQPVGGVWRAPHRAAPGGRERNLPGCEPCALPPPRPSPYASP